MKFSSKRWEVEVMRDLGRVIGFTVKNKVRTKSFIVTTVIMVLLISLLANLPFLISLIQTEKTDRFGMVQDAGGLAEQLAGVLAAEESGDAELVLFADQGSEDANETMLREQVLSGEIIGFLTITGMDDSGFPTLAYKSGDTLDFDKMGKLQNGLRLIKYNQVSAELGLTESQLAMLNSPVQIAKVQISLSDTDPEGGKSEGEIVIATILVYAMIILLFIAVMVSGQLIATEITMEKSSRIMEILITSVKPLTQMFGKIIGMFFVGISQLLVLFAGAIANLVLPHNRAAFANLNIDLSEVDLRLLLYALLFYLTGYLLYATLYAAVGSIVSRTEDLGQAVMPISILSMIGYFIAIFGIQDPTGTLVVISSYVPFFSPFIMFLRMGVTEPPLWEVWLSIGLLIAAIFFFGWLSAKIYRTGVLMYGKRPTFKELRKAMKAYKI